MALARAIFGIPPIIDIDAVRFNTLASVTHTEGQAHWDSEDKTLELDTEISGIHIKVGQELLVRATNKSGVDYDKATVVIVDGAQGFRPTIAKAIASSEPLSDGTIGFTAHAIDNNDTGYVVTEGFLRDIDTGTFAEGDKLYLSPTVAGGFTNSAPDAPYHTVQLGYVLKSHSTEGIAYVRVQNGWEIGELHDVHVSGIADNQLLKYVAANSRWENSDTFAVASMSISTLTPGSVLFAGASGLITQDNAKLFFDDTNNNLRINAATAGTNAKSVLVIGTDTAPAGNVADAVQFYSADFAAGNACPYFRTENGTVIGINQSLLTTDSPVFAGATFTSNPIINNNVYLQCKNSGGTATNILQLSSSNVVVLTGPGDMFVIPGAANYVQVRGSFFGGQATPLRSTNLASANVANTVAIGFQMSHTGTGSPVDVAQILGHMPTLSTAYDGALSFKVAASATLFEACRLDKSGNFLLGITAAGTSATKAIAIATGVPPTTSPTDAVQFYSMDRAAGQAGLAIRNEGGIHNMIGDRAGFGFASYADLTALHTMLQVNGGEAFAVVTKTATYSVGINDRTIRADASAATMSIVIMSPSGITGRTYAVTKIDSTANVVKVQFTSATCNGVSEYVIATQYTGAVFVADSTSNTWAVF